jgi:hypothetical protein
VGGGFLSKALGYPVQVSTPSLRSNARWSGRKARPLSGLWITARLHGVKLAEMEWPEEENARGKVSEKSNYLLAKY